jgi:hypothetical protein
MPSREATEATVETRHAETVHGEVAYETVRCANCRHEMQTTEAVPVGLGLRETGDLYVGERTRQAYSADEVAYLCSYCAESTFDYDGASRRFDALAAKTAPLSTVERAVLALGALAFVGLFVLNLAVVF